MTVLAVAKDQVADLRRRRLVLVLIIGGALVALMFSVQLIAARKLSAAQLELRQDAAGEVTEEERLQVKQMLEMSTSMMETGLYGLVSFVGAILALVMFCSLVSSERSRGTLPWVLARPLTRGQFVLGKWLGACAVIAIYTAIMSAILLGYNWFAEGTVFAMTGYSSVLMLFMFILVGSVGMALSMVMPPAIGGVLAFFAGGDTILRIAKHILPVYYLLPSYNQFSFHTQFFMGAEIRPTRVLLLAAYALAYSAVMLWLAQQALRRHDLA